MRSVKSLVVAAATALLSTAAVAADVPSIAPPPPAPYPQAYSQPSAPMPARTSEQILVAVNMDGLPSLKTRELS